MEDFGGLDGIGTDNLEQQQGTEKKEGITQADIQRVREQSEKAKKVSQQIHSSKQTNHKFADFITFLLQEIQNEKIINGIYQVFFKTTNPKDNLKYLKKSINFLVVTGVFAPFYMEQIKHFGLFPYYEKLYNFQNKINLDEYIIYLKNLSKSYHDNVPINKQDFLNFLVELFIQYKLTTPGMKEADTEEEKKLAHKQFYKYIEKKLFD